MEITSGEGLIIVCLCIIGYFMYHVLNTTRLCVKEQKNHNNYLVLKFKYSFKSEELYSLLKEQKDYEGEGKLYYASDISIDIVRSYNIFASERLAMVTDDDVSLDDFLATGEYLHNIMVLSKKVGLIVPDCLQPYSVDNLLEVITWLCKKPRGKEPYICILPSRHVQEFESCLMTFKDYISKCNHYSALLKPILEMERLIRSDRNNKLTRA